MLTVSIFSRLFVRYLKRSKEGGINLLFWAWTWMVKSIHLSIASLTKNITSQS